MSLRSTTTCLRTLTLALIAVAATATMASAQTIGTFRWQMLPACNVVSITVTQTGSLFQLIGTDDLCGFGQVPLYGSAVAAGSDVRMGFDIAAPGGRTSHVTTAVSLGGLSGTWADDNANGGPFAFLIGAATPGGALRPTPATNRPEASYRGDGVAVDNLGAGVVSLPGATITVPSGGTLVANAHVSTTAAGSPTTVDCALSLSTTFSDTFSQSGTATNGSTVTISTARHFSVSAGTHVVRLLCRRAAGSTYSLSHPQVSVIFVP